MMMEHLTVSISVGKMLLKLRMWMETATASLTVKMSVLPTLKRCQLDCVDAESPTSIATQTVRWIVRTDVLPIPRRVQLDPVVVESLTQI
jgi:hypothetical protein